MEESKTKHLGDAELGHRRGWVEGVFFFDWEEGDKKASKLVAFKLFSTIFCWGKNSSLPDFDLGKDVIPHFWRRSDFNLGWLMTLLAIPRIASIGEHNSTQPTNSTPTSNLKNLKNHKLQSQVLQAEINRLHSWSFLATSVADFFPRKSKASAKRALPSNGIDTQRFAARVEGFARCGTHLRPVFWGVFLHQNGSLRNVASTDFFGGDEIGPVSKLCPK